ncbi:hypothetical protein [Vallitalea guaymasensis]|uniref:hypothetical protein n=1 Tax=Vallitalea guaymasensis TaxID=1185412 RepID=UPI00187D0CDA|nr:hypothetical protein [Vallitalea guaymasensis]
MGRSKRKLICDLIIVLVCFIVFIYLFGFECLVAFMPFACGAFIVILFIKLLEFFM